MEGASCEGAISNEDKVQRKKGREKMKKKNLRTRALAATTDFRSATGKRNSQWTDKKKKKWKGKRWKGGRGREGESGENYSLRMADGLQVCPFFPPLSLELFMARRSSSPYCPGMAELPKNIFILQARSREIFAWPTSLSKPGGCLKKSANKTIHSVGIPILDLQDVSTKERRKKKEERRKKKELNTCLCTLFFSSPPPPSLRASSPWV